MSLRNKYPTVKSPLIVCAPMRGISSPELVVAILKAGGLAFLGAGYDMQNLDEMLTRTRTLINESKTHELPLCVGIISWGSSLNIVARLMAKHKPSAVWLFAPQHTSDFREWIQQIKQASECTQVWVQVASVREAFAAVEFGAEVLVVQGEDAGGHGSIQGASIVTLVPEVCDALAAQNRLIPVIAAGGIMDGRGVVAALSLGAQGVAMGTRFLASQEAFAPESMKEWLVKISDGGQNTTRTRVYDKFRGDNANNWPAYIGGRVIKNQTWIDHINEVEESDMRAQYQTAKTNNDFTRLNIFAGTGVGLIRDIPKVEDLINNIINQAKALLASTHAI